MCSAFSHSFIATPSSTENVRVKCNFPAKSQSCRVRKTQNPRFVLERLKGNVTVTISHAKVNPAVLQHTHVTTDLRRENTQKQDWRDCCQACGSEFIPQNPHCKKTKLTHSSYLWTFIHSLWHVYVHTHKHKRIKCSWGQTQPGVVAHACDFNSRT